MRVLIDTNIILDWLMARSPFYANAERIMKECFFGDLEGYVASHTITNLFYILRKDFSVKERKELLLLICSYFQIISEDKAAIISVLRDENCKDIEDGLQMMCASLQNLDFIVTRNISDFQTSIVPAVSPEKFIALYFAEK